MSASASASSTLDASTAAAVDTAFASQSQSQSSTETTGQQQPQHYPPEASHRIDTATAPAPDSSSTSSHPQQSQPNPTLTSTSTSSNNGPAAPGQQSTTHAARAAELARLKIGLRSGLRQFPDFPSPGVLFEDILPLFASPQQHSNLVRALELQLLEAFADQKIDVIVGLESRGFLFAPTLALRLGAAFVPVRKTGKLPGKCETESFVKEYGADHFQMQSDAIGERQRVVVMDDIIATGKSFRCMFRRWISECLFFLIKKDIKKR